MPAVKIAITGIGLVSAQGIGVKGTLQNLLKPSIRLGKVSLFETELNVPVCEVPLSDKDLEDMLGTKRTRTAMLGILAASEALMDCFGTDSVDELRKIVGDSALRIGLVSATSVAGMDKTERFYKQYLHDGKGETLDDIRGHDCGDSTNVIADYCAIKGFRTTVSTACSSSANAIIFGANLIKQDILDMVVVGGTDALCLSTLNGFNSLKILDSEACRPFDESRAGLNLGEGAGYIVLQRDDALQRGDTIDDTLKAKPYAYLSGYANATDAFHQTASSENGEGAFLSMREALQQSGLQPKDIDYINVHGTGTPNNDSSEGAAILRVFTESPYSTKPPYYTEPLKLPPFSSTKPLTGHTLAASGGIEAVLCILALKHGLLYPNLNFRTAFNPLLIPQTTLQKDVKLQNIMSNSFGFGGNNSSIIFSTTEVPNSSNLCVTPHLANTHYPSDNSVSLGSRALTFEVLEPRYKLYINAISSSDTLSTEDIKELIPDAMLRRRMSTLIKAGVATAINCLQNYTDTEASLKTQRSRRASEETRERTEVRDRVSSVAQRRDLRNLEMPDAIITATALGFIQDGEKFLRNIFENSEQLLNPTPFIQSTFNTIGAQIALLTGNHAYNTTYSHRTECFTHAMLDAYIRISQYSASNVLVGAFDEKTPSLITFLKMLNIAEPKHSGAIFMLVSKEKTSNTITEININELLKQQSPRATACSSLDIPMQLI